jgi:2-methylisocitrate lyase-like PEP mutase family enzyme
MEVGMTQAEKAKQFAAFHIKGTPLILFNAWDAGTAKVIQSAGAKAIATSSWSVAEAQGYRDGEHIPLSLVEQIIARITKAVDVPVTVDIEGGYSEDDGVLAKNVARLIDLGVIGINFEDRVVQGDGLYPVQRQAQRIAAVRDVANKQGVELFINARTDVFFGDGDPEKLVGEALVRAKAYEDAGASGFFIPGLTDDALIKKISDNVSLPVNVMVMDGLSPAKRLAELGVARISYGPIPYIKAMNALKEEARASEA